MKRSRSPSDYIVPGLLVGFAFGYVSPWTSYSCIAVGVIGGWILAARLLRGWILPALLAFTASTTFTVVVLSGSNRWNWLNPYNWATPLHSPLLAVEIAMLAVWGLVVLLLRRGVRPQDA